MFQTGRDNKDRIKDLVLENGEVIEGVGQFCYLRDVLNDESGSNMASINRVRSGWKKFRELSGVLTNKVALRLKGRVYAACVRSAILYGSETWAANTEQVARLSRVEIRMVRCMCGVSSLRERKINAELRKSLGIKDIDEVVRWSRLRWMGHVLRKDKEKYGDGYRR